MQNQSSCARVHEILQFTVPPKLNHRPRAKCWFRVEIAPFFEILFCGILTWCRNSSINKLFLQFKTLIHILLAGFFEYIEDFLENSSTSSADDLRGAKLSKGITVMTKCIFKKLDASRKSRILTFCMSSSCCCVFILALVLAFFLLLLAWIEFWQFRRITEIEDFMNGPMKEEQESNLYRQRLFLEYLKEHQEEHERNRQSKVWKMLNK